MFSMSESVAPRGVDRYPGSECAGGSGGDQHYGLLGMFSVCKSVASPRSVDRYPGSECAGGNGGDQHYGPLGMFSVCTVRA